MTEYTHATVGEDKHRNVVIRLYPDIQNDTRDHVDYVIPRHLAAKVGIEVAWYATCRKRISDRD